MLRFVLRRLFWMVLVTFAVISISFVLIQKAPGSPFSRERGLNATVEHNLRSKYGFDQPGSIQYVRFIGRLLGFQYGSGNIGYVWHPYPDFGDSIKYPDRSVNEIILEGMPVSAIVALVSYGLAVLIGIPSGVICAHWYRRGPDHLLMAFVILGVCVPSFVLGPLLVQWFSLELYWFPPARIEWAMEHGHWRLPTPLSMVLPIVTLTSGYVAHIARLTKTGLVETLGENYVRTARAKGLSEWRVTLVHALPAACLPVLSFTGPALASLIAGTAVVETVFAIPGLGRYFVEAAINRDFFLVLGLSAFATILLMMSNLLIDILYATIDPRLRHHAL